MSLRFHYVQFQSFPEMTWATDICTDPSCSWISNPDIVLSSSLGLNDILATGGRGEYSDRDGFGCDMVPRHQ